MKKNNELYIEDITSDPKYGDVQILIAGEKEDKKDKEKKPEKKEVEKD